jgi:hypothetical protein
MGADMTLQTSERKKVVEPPLPSDSETVTFDKVFASELAAINARRNRLRVAYQSFQAPDFPENTPTGKERSVIDAVGLAISGGGIRSAAFGLGVLQALDAVHNRASSENTTPTPSLLDRVDYLSTVSGGGYIGCSLCAHLSNSEGHFPFRSELDQDETPSIQHIRNFSNYLFPNGIRDVLDSVAIYLRGLLANFIIIVPLMLLLAVFTILCSPMEGQLLKARFYLSVVGRFGDSFPDALKFESFGFTKLLFVLSMLLFLVWAARSVVERMKDFKIWTWIADVVHGLRVWLLPHLKGKSAGETRNFSETGSRWARAGGVGLLVLVLCAFCELQPLLLKKLFDMPARPKTNLQI